MSSKLKDLILYIAHKSHDDPSFGSTKLNKILFLADFYSYGLWGEPITDTTYVHRQFGPTPKDMHIVQRELENEQRAVIEEREHFGHKQKRIVPLANPDLSKFTPAQIRLLNDVMHAVQDLSATQLSDITHTFQPWLSTSNGEEIPFDAVFVLEQVPATREDIAWAEECVAEFE